LDHRLEKAGTFSDRQEIHGGESPLRSRDHPGEVHFGRLFDGDTIMSRAHLTESYVEGKTMILDSRNSTSIQLFDGCGHNWSIIPKKDISLFMSESNLNFLIDASEMTGKDLDSHLNCQGL
jgi:hypothetical protein